MKPFNIDSSFDRLLKAMPPPPQPLETSGLLPTLAFANGNKVVFPPDFLRLVRAYGSGGFHSKEPYGSADDDNQDDDSEDDDNADDDNADDEGSTIGNLVYLMNPFAPSFQQRLQARSQSLQEHKAWTESEGDEQVPYSVYPKTPGVLQWGFTDQRLDYFWLTEGKPEDWPVLVMHDLEIWTRFDMPTVVFLEQFFFGKIDCSVMGWVEEYSRRDPSRIYFEPQIPPEE